jgi:putative flippase GtrA
MRLPILVRVSFRSSGSGAFPEAPEVGVGDDRHRGTTVVDPALDEVPPRPTRPRRLLPMTLDAFAGDDAQIRPPAGMNGDLGPLFRLVRDQRIAFLIVGGMNTAIGAVWFVLFLWLFPHGAVGYLSALVCAYLAATLCAFVLYRRFVFRVTGHVLRDLARFGLVNLSALGFNFATLPVLVEVLGWPVLPSQFAIAGVTVVYSWFAHRGFSFRRSPAEIGPAEQTQT